jgi:ribonuclease P protein component
VLPLQHRINRGEDFRRILRSGVKSRSAVGTIALAPSSGPFRLGVIASKAVGGAVVRNRVKRTIRAAAHERAVALEGWDVVVRCSEDAGAASFHEVLSFIDSALAKAKQT